jgi:hypothetical protein
VGSVERTGDNHQLSDPEFLVKICVITGSTRLIGGGRPLFQLEGAPLQIVEVDNDVRKPVFGDDDSTQGAGET